jgi:mRNA interferase HigB
MRTISYKMFRESISKHPDCAKQLRLLYEDLKKVDFKNLNQVKEFFPYVSLLNDNRVVFNVHGNKYRVVVKFNFSSNICFVRYIGTHAEYDKIDANKI